MRYMKKQAIIWVSSIFRRLVNEVLLFWDVYAALMGSYRRFGTTYRSPIQESSSQRSSYDFVTLEDEIDSLSQNVGK